MLKEAFFIVAVIAPDGRVDADVQPMMLAPAVCVEAQAAFQYSGPLFIDDERPAGWRVNRFVVCPSVTEK